MKHLIPKSNKLLNLTGVYIVFKAAIHLFLKLQIEYLLKCKDILNNMMKK